LVATCFDWRYFEAANSLGDAPFPNKLDRLLDKLCLDLGFCLPYSKCRILLERDSWEAEAFAREVVRLEGLNPDYEPKFVRMIARRFIKRFGTSFVRAHEY